MCCVFPKLIVITSMRRLPNTAMHQSRLRSLYVFLPGSLRPGDGERWEALAQLERLLLQAWQMAWKPLGR